MFDLLIMCVVRDYFLIKSLGGDQVPFVSINHESGAPYGPEVKNRHIIMRELAEIIGLR
jgi:hypothetical protein